MLSDFLESEEFYNMMQSYRFCPIGYPQEVKDRFEAIKAAIEAAVLPEGWVAVPKEPPFEFGAWVCRELPKNTVIGDPHWWIPRLYKAMIAAAPKPAQSCDMGKLCLGCSPRNADGSCPDAAQAEKQEPYKRGMTMQECADAEYKQEPANDEPVAYVDHNLRKSIVWVEDYTKLPNETLLYTRPQPDLTAEVERLRYELKETREAYINQSARVVLADQRIAALEEAAREARDALQYKLHVVEAIAKLDAVLGNRRKYGD